MFVVGLAGQIASGKSTVAAVWKRRGAAIISGDELGRQAVRPGSPALRRLARVFGKDIIDSRGRLRRSILAQRAFADANSLEQLNRIVHPELLRHLHAELARLRRAGAKLVVIDAALILDWRLERKIDLLVVVESSLANQLRRLNAKGVSASEARRRIRRQMPKSRQRHAANFVLRNNGASAELKAAALKLWEAIISRAAHKTS